MINREFIDIMSSLFFIYRSIAKQGDIEWIKGNRYLIIL